MKSLKLQTRLALFIINLAEIKPQRLKARNIFSRAIFVELLFFLAIK